MVGGWNLDVRDVLRHHTDVGFWHNAWRMGRRASGVVAVRIAIRVDRPIADRVRGLIHTLFLSALIFIVGDHRRRDV